ncbi:MAG: endolytic transglycosylase MltG [Pseudomonadota bacterium]
MLSARFFRTRWLKILLIVAGIALSAGGYVLWRYADAISSPMDFGEQTYRIEKGATLASIANDLVNKGVVSEPYSLRFLARKEGVGHKIKAGDYQFPKNLMVKDFLDWIVEGKGQLGIKVTIIEGWTFRQMRQKLGEQKSLVSETAEWTDQQIMQALGHPDLHPEGQFFPDTYLYRAGESDLAVYRRAFQTMQRKMDNYWQERLPDIQIKTPYEALIMASIIEKETQAREETGLISGVFDNRLKKGMRLQTDPTVIYGIGPEFDGDITRKHLKTDTPYNTYTRNGLPPTPISLPGDDSLRAAVTPKETTAFYFVAKGGGKHKFSDTLKEHNRAVQKYILNK